MRIIESFSNWKNSISIDENIAASKIYMQKKLATILKKPVSELTPEETAKALTNKDYIKILDIVKETPGYAMAFVKFYFDQGITLDQLAELANTLKTKKHIIQQLPNSVDYYAGLETGSDNITGFEKLNDAIRTIERAKEVKWFIDRLPRGLRDQYRALPAEKQAGIINTAHQLSDLGKQAIDRLFDKIKAFNNSTIEELMDYVSKYLSGFSNLGMKSKIDAIEALEPEAGIIYSDDRYLVMSIRTENAQKQLCSVANWCINRGSFSGYANDAVQLNIFDFGKDSSDPLFLTGTTIYYTGKVRTAHDINDLAIKKSDNPAAHFKELGYPDQLINAITDQFATESVIKKVVYDLGLDSKKPIDVLKGIIMQSYGMPADSNPESLAIVLDIVESRIKQQLTKEDVITLYLQYGVLSGISAKLLKLVADDITPDEMNQIIKATLGKFEIVHRAIKQSPQFATEPKIANVLSQEKSVLRELGLNPESLSEIAESLDPDYYQGLVEFLMAEPAVAPTIAPTKPKTRPFTPSRPSPVPTKRPFKTPEPAKAQAEDVIKRLEILQNEEL